MNKKKKSSSKIATKGGVYALIITVIVLGIFILAFAALSTIVLELIDKDKR